MIQALRDPMSKTLIACLVGVGSLTLLGLTVTIAVSLHGIVLDGATVGLLSTIVAGITGSVGMVASRAQGPTSPKTTPPVADP